MESFIQKTSSWGTAEWTLLGAVLALLVGIVVWFVLNAKKEMEKAKREEEEIMEFLKKAKSAQLPRPTKSKRP